MISDRSSVAGLHPKAPTNETARFSDKPNDLRNIVSLTPSSIAEVRVFFMTTAVFIIVTTLVW